MFKFIPYYIDVRDVAKKKVSPLPDLRVLRLIHQDLLDIEGNNFEWLKK